MPDPLLTVFTMMVSLSTWLGDALLTEADTEATTFGVITGCVLKPSDGDSSVGVVDVDG